MRTVHALEFEGNRALIRVDFNVPLSDDGEILDDARIRAALPTIEHVLDAGAAAVLMSHLGRPKGEPDERLRLAPVAERLGELLPGREVRHVDQVVGERVEREASNLQPGQVLLIENLRFEPGEKADDAQLAEQLAGLGDVYVNDAFAACHRRHASVHALPQRFAPGARAIGRLVQRETAALTEVLEDPERPLLAILGGAKVSDKLDTLRALVNHADRILIGGAMTYTFMKARGQEVGNSKVEEDHLDAAREILEAAGDRLLLPIDHAVARGERPQRERNYARDGIAEGLTGLDIGPETVTRYQQEIRKAHTIVWNGPMGKIELDEYLAGTQGIADAIAHGEATSIVGGGETGEVVRRLGLDGEMSHVSTGGGAFLEYIAHGTLPALAVMADD